MQQQMTVQNNNREIHAKTFALDKSREVSGEIVQSVLDRSHSSVPDLSYIREAEEYIERRIVGLLKHSLMEFTDMYLADVERRLEAMQRLLETSHEQTTGVSGQADPVGTIS